MRRGIAYLVGAGPGDLGLVTLRARRLIEQADVIIYDYLCNPEMLQWASPFSECLYAGKQGGEHSLPQQEINAWLIDRIKAGKTVVRLKGGDPFIFGRGGEEAQAIIDAGLQIEVVPGVSSALAVPAYAGIPVTHRDYASSVLMLTGHEDPNKEISTLDWKRVAADQGTRIILMAMGRLRKITETLMEQGAQRQTPCALIRWGTYPRQQVVEGALNVIANLAENAKLRPPAILVLGEVVRLREQLNWYERRPLFGRRIVVTRSRNQAQGLAEELRELGADVLEIPTIQIGSRDWTWNVRSSNLSDTYDWLIFTSPNAVDFFFSGYLAKAGDIRRLGSIQIGVVGPMTAAKVRDRHLSVARQPDRFNVEELGKAFSNEEVKGRRFCLVRGNLADSTMRDYLESKGGLVDEWVVYETLPEPADRTGMRKRFLAEGADWVTFTSSSTVTEWNNWIKRSGYCGSAPLCASIGPATSATLRSLGYPIACEAAEATIDGLLQALIRHSGRK